MEKYTVLWVRRFNSIINSPQIDLQVQCNPHQNHSSLFFFVEIDQLTKIHKEIHSSSSVFPFYNERSQDTAQLFLFPSTSCQELQFLSTGCENMRAVRGQKPGSDQLRRQCLYNWDVASGQTLLVKVRPRPRFFVPSWAHISYFGLEDGACMSH